MCAPKAPKIDKQASQPVLVAPPPIDEVDAIGLSEAESYTKARTKRRRRSTATAANTASQGSYGLPTINTGVQLTT